MNDPQMNDILAKLNAVGSKPASASNNRSSSAGDPAMHDILSKFHAVSGKYQVNEGLGAEQKRVGQLDADFVPASTSKPVKHGERHPMQGKLVGEDVDNDAASLTMGVPLFLRMLEYAREEAQTDEDLHVVTMNMLNIGGNLSMDNYDDIMHGVERGSEDYGVEEAAGDKLTDLEYGSSTATQTPTVGGYHQRRDLETGAYTDYTDRGPISTQTTYDKSGQMTSQHAQARVGDQSMARSRFYPKRNESNDLRKLAGLATEDYVGGKEAPQDLVKSLSKSYRDFVKEVEQQTAAKPDRELRSKTEKPRKFGNILGEE